MTIELLKLIALVQSYRTYKQNEISLIGDIHTDCPDDLTFEYYKTLPVELLDKYALKKNKLSFDKVLHYPIRKELLETEAKNLERYSF